MKKSTTKPETSHKDAGGRVGKRGGSQNRQSAPYSIRFDPRQRALIDQAATILGIGHAQLIRDGAVIRAAGVCNAKGGERALPRLGASIAAKLVAGNWEEIVDGTWTDTTAPSREGSGAIDQGLPPPTLDEVVRALATCPMELAAVLRAEMEARIAGTSDTYRASVDPTDVLLRGGKK